MIAETIFALSTLFGKSGVAVIRISGPRAVEAIRLFKVKRNILPRKAEFAKIYSPSDDTLLDEAIITYFRAPKSFTGEDVIEISLHGSIAVIKDVLQELSKISFLRAAEPGEFSKRAFLNDKLDLTKAEGLSELMAAETSIQRQVAIRQMLGDTSNLFNKWRSQLVTILSQLEALIDFPDDDLPIQALQQATIGINQLAGVIDQYIKSSAKSDTLMQGAIIAIIGPPNAGKSTLINAITKQNTAIVSDIPGTTRDVIKMKLDISGYAVLITDTAGIRESNDPIEQEGVKRAMEQIQDAAIKILVLDIEADQRLSFLDFLLTKIDRQQLADNTICIFNKEDIISSPELLVDGRTKLISLGVSADKIITHSMYQSTDHVINMITEILRDSYQLNPEVVALSLRQRARLKETVKNLLEFSLSKPFELAVQDIRFAATELGALTGHISTEEILDEVFKTFCIGK